MNKENDPCLIDAAPTKPHRHYLVGDKLTIFGFGIPLIILIFLAALSYQSIQRLREHAGGVEHTQQVQIELEQLMSIYANARIGWRSFLITGNSEYQQKYEAAAQAIQLKIQSLKTLNTDNTRQQTRLSSFSSMVNDDIAAMRDSIKRKAAGTLAQPSNIVDQLNSVKLNSIELTALTQKMKEEEDTLLAIRVGQSEDSANHTKLILIVGNILSLTLLVLAFVCWRQEAQRRWTAEEARSKNEEHFRSVIQSANDAVISANGSGDIIFWNEGAHKIFGYLDQEVLGKPLTLLMPERYHAAHSHGMQRFLTTGEKHVIGKTIELRALKKNGTEFSMEISLAQWQSGGETFFSALIRDITDRKQVEEAALRSEERFRLMVESVVDYAILMLDAEGHIVSWNAGAERIKGYRADEILGQHFSRFYSSEDIEQGKPVYEIAGATANGRFEDEGWRVRKDGTLFWANVIITAIRSADGGLRGFVKVTRDLTERKQAEAKILSLNAGLQTRTTELMAANTDLEAFSYSVAHDLRSPLRKIVGYSTLLTEEHGTQLDPGAHTYLRKVREGALRMADLVDNLLNLAKLGKKELSSQSTSLNTILQSVIEELQSDYNDRQIEWRIGELFIANCDPGLIKQVFANLLLNALKYTRHRELAIIEIGSTVINSERVVFVRDNGIGFDMQYVGKLFKVFERLHGNDRFEGTGIGLATVERIIRKHDGRVWAEGESERGATFFFTLGSFVE
ncbi:MAG: PAS domain S-box protein [Pseudomonadota bacterium]